MASSHSSIDSAREARRDATLAEQRAWDILKGRGLGGLKFRRQHRFGRFRVDFYCPALHLALEIDGGIHDEPDHRYADRERGEYLAAAGITVLRIPNDRVTRHALRELIESFVRGAAAPCEVSPSKRQPK